MGIIYFNKSSVEQLDRKDALDLAKLANDRVESIDAKVATDKHGELMVPYKAVEVRLVALKYAGQIHTCDYLLHRVILSKGNTGIRSVTAMLTVLLDSEDNPTFIHGQDPRSNTRITFEVLDWQGEVSTSVDCTGYIEAAYIKLVETTVYLPADME